MCVHISQRYYRFIAAGNTFSFSFPFSLSLFSISLSFSLSLSVSFSSLYAHSLRRVLFVRPLSRLICAACAQSIQSICVSSVRAAVQANHFFPYMSPNRKPPYYTASERSLIDRRRSLGKHNPIFIPPKVSKFNGRRLC